MAGKGTGSSNEAASGHIVEAVTESRSPGHVPSSITLRALFDDRANQAFPQGGVADVAVDTYEIDFRLAEIQRALVAHDAINRQLSMMGVTDLPDKFLVATEQAHALGVITEREKRWLTSMNTEANKAKHGEKLSFTRLPRMQ